jgi:anti-sigma regulatory factor (Ser/Thr protein kinase)
MASAPSPADGDESPQSPAESIWDMAASMRRGVAALREENRLLRVELGRLQSGVAAEGADPPARGLPAGLTQAVLPADRKAPAAARTLLGLCAGPYLDARVLSDAQLVLSELVTNSLVHAGLGGEDSIVVRVARGAGTLRLEVRNPGVVGEIASDGGDRARGRGFGLELVTLLSTSWGVRRDRDTCVWVEMGRAA